MSDDAGGCLTCALHAAGFSESELQTLEAALQSGDLAAVDEQRLDLLIKIGVDHNLSELEHQFHG